MKLIRIIPENRIQQNLRVGYTASRVLMISFIALFVAAGCASSSKSLQKGRYDEAIERSVKKLSKKPAKTEELVVLKESFLKANEIDQRKVNFLLLEQREEGWEELLSLYRRLDRRQDVVRSAPLNVREEFEFLNYDSLIVDAKANAARVSYEKGVEFLEEGGKLAARKAWEEFRKAESVYQGYRDAQALAAEAMEKGINHVLILFENRSDNVIPVKVFEELSSLPTRALDTRWTSFTSQDDDQRQYDRIVIVSLADVEFTPERVESRTYEVKKTIKKPANQVQTSGASGEGSGAGAGAGDSGGDGSGSSRAIRSNGTTSGSSGTTSGATASTAPAASSTDTVTYVAEAELTKTIYFKAARSRALFEIMDGPSGELLHRTDVVIESVFEDSSLVMRGNMEALSDSEAALLKRRPRPFPSNELLLTDAMAIVKTRLSDYIKTQRKRFEEVR